MASTGEYLNYTKIVIAYCLDSNLKIYVESILCVADKIFLSSLLLETFNPINILANTCEYCVPI